MAKVLGLDLGTNSIGWALVDTDKNELLNAGVKIFPITKSLDRTTSRQVRRQKYCLAKNESINKTFSFDKKKIALAALTVFTAITTLAAFTNFINWQFWLNISMTSLVALLTLLYQDKK